MSTKNIKKSSAKQISTAKKAHGGISWKQVIELSHQLNKLWVFRDQ